jgi:hypothetical protein
LPKKSLYVRLKKATGNTVTNIQGHKLKKVQTCSLHETYKETTKNSRNYKKFNSERPLLFPLKQSSNNKHQTEKGDRLKRGQVTSDKLQRTGYRLQITEAPSYNIKALAGGCLEEWRLHYKKS